MDEDEQSTQQDQEAGGQELVQRSRVVEAPEAEHRRQDRTGRTQVRRPEDDERRDDEQERDRPVEQQAARRQPDLAQQPVRPEEHSVEEAPDDEGPRGPMPESGEEHRQHEVHRRPRRTPPRAA